MLKHDSDQPMPRSIYVGWTNGTLPREDLTIDGVGLGRSIRIRPTTEYYRN
jgi:hypothetical protein